VKEPDGGLLLKGKAAGEELEEGDAEGVEVAAVVDAL